MKADSLCVAAEKALQMQRKLLKNLERQIINVKGYLIVRKIADHKLYYQATKIKTAAGWRTKSKNITASPEIVRKLAEKGRSKKIKRICRNNIKVLETALGKYIPLTSDVLMPPNYRDILVENNSNQQYKTFPFDPSVHIHSTVCGIMVRSKSEAIIANALWHYGIKFVYEELFPYRSEDGKWYYPDFTIHLPDGRVIMWEHWGLLNKPGYCARNADKLYTYNANNFVIGKNLIITQDETDGACDSAFIYQIIEEYILPYFV